MNDLISRKAVMEAIEESMRENPHTDQKTKMNHNIEHQHFMAIVGRQPTSYDVDKVVERLRGEVRCIVDTYCGSLPDDAYGDLEALEQEGIEEIVKGGGN